MSATHEPPTLPGFDVAPPAAAGLILPTVEEATHVDALLARLAAGETIGADEVATLPPRVDAMLRLCLDLRAKERAERAVAKPPLVLSAALAHVLRVAPKGGRVYLHCDGARVSLLAYDDHRALLIDAAAPGGWPFFTRSVSVDDARRLVKLAPPAGDWLPWTEVTSWPSIWADLARDRSDCRASAVVGDLAPVVAWLRESVRRRVEYVYLDVLNEGGVVLSEPSGEVDPQPEGVRVGCAADPQYVLDALESCPAESVSVLFETGRLAPVRLLAARSNWHAILMPRRSCAASPHGSPPHACPCRDCTSERRCYSPDITWVRGLHHGPRLPWEGTR